MPFLDNYEFIVYLHICAGFLLLLVKIFKFTCGLLQFQSRNVDCLLMVDLTLFKRSLHKNELYIVVH